MRRNERMLSAAKFRLCARGHVGRLAGGQTNTCILFGAVCSPVYSYIISTACGFFSVLSTPIRLGHAVLSTVDMNTARYEAAARRVDVGQCESCNFFLLLVISLIIFPSQMNQRAVRATCLLFLAFAMTNRNDVLKIFFLFRCFCALFKARVAL